MPINNWKIGADPEILLFDLDTSVGFLSDRIFEGTKAKHIWIGNGCDIHNDGAAVEYNIPPTNKINE